MERRCQVHDICAVRASTTLDVEMPPLRGDDANVGLSTRFTDEYELAFALRPRAISKWSGAIANSTKRCEHDEIPLAVFGNALVIAGEMLHSRTW